MKKILLISSLITALCTSCQDFLDRKPLDFGNEESYYKNDYDLKIAVNEFYLMLPRNNDLWGGTYTEDTQSDNQTTGGAEELFYPGVKKTVKMEDYRNQWRFNTLREINFFLQKAKEKAADIKGNQSLTNHYIGEGYFFRAYEHFRLLRHFGDAPILTQVVNDQQSQIASLSVRQPRNELARFIIAQLDTATTLLQDQAPETGRITKDAALLLKSRVALYEATWERYHAGTCFVPGNPKWVGAKQWPDFKFKAGSPEAEVNWFLEQAIASAQQVADKRSLNTDYAEMFCQFQKPFDNNDEVILARYYLDGVLSHSASVYLLAGGGCGVTRAAVNTFLMTNGLPIYDAQAKYKGDQTSYEELQDRDHRLTLSVKPAGRFIKTVLKDGKYTNDTIFYYAPRIQGSGHEKSTTGYDLIKWLSSDKEQRKQNKCTTATPIFRAAEALLNYIEAYYERYGNLGGQCDKYWKQLRQRAGVYGDYQKTISHTDLEQENDLAVWSKGKQVDPTLYNIRRERRCEFIAEGMRLDDLKRWRSLDKMVNYQPEGFNLWDKMYEMYKPSDLNPGAVSQSSISKYIRPLQRSSTSVTYNGYNFPKPHYLEPIPLSEFKLTTDKTHGLPSKLYQNPGWPRDVDGTADYGYDCD